MSSNYCGKCGSKLNQEVFFCTSCGSSVDLTDDSNPIPTSNINVHHYYKSNSDNATIAIYIALGGLFISGGLLSILGLVFAYKGKRLNEDKNRVVIALVLNYTALFLIAAGLIVMVVMLSTIH